jgi:hypothetical protein
MYLVNIGSCCPKTFVDKAIVQTTKNKIVVVTLMLLEKLEYDLYWGGLKINV